MINEDILLHLSLFAIFFIVPIFFYTTEDKRLLLGGYAIQFMIVLTASVFLFVDRIIFLFSIWGVYAFSICCFLEARKLQNSVHKKKGTFIIPIVATCVAGLFFVLCLVFSTYMFQLISRPEPWIQGIGMMHCAIALYAFALIIEVYYVLACDKYKIKYFVGGLLPYLSLFVLGISFLSTAQAYYLISTLVFWLLAIGTATFIKKYRFIKTGLPQNMEEVI